MTKERTYSLDLQVSKAAASVGLDTSTLEKVAVVLEPGREAAGISTPLDSKKGRRYSHGKEVVIMIPPGNLHHLSELRRSLRHELSHLKWGEVGRADSARESARRDIRTVKSSEGKISSYSLANLTLRLVEDYGVLKREAMSIVREEATKQGIPKSMSIRANRLLYGYWKGQIS